MVRHHLIEEAMEEETRPREPAGERNTCLGVMFNDHRPGYRWFEEQREDDGSRAPGATQAPAQRDPRERTVPARADRVPMGKL